MTYTESTVTGATQHSATTLITSPYFPSANLSLGIGLPTNRRQITQKMVMVYENVRATLTRDTIALKPVAGPKLMQAKAKAIVTVIQTERRGVSKSRTST